MRIDFSYPTGYSKPWKTIRTKEYDEWLDQLKDSRARNRIIARTTRIEREGHLLGDWKSVGDGVLEIRFDFGPGYRVYIHPTQGNLLLLLAGGDKASQNRDVILSKWLLKQWKEHHHEQ